MLAELLRRVRYWLSGARVQAELDEEIALHIAQRAEKLQAEGLSAAEAMAKARRSFGNRLVLREQSRDVWIGRWLDDLARDVRIGIRGLRRNSGFSLVALITLALGIGANTAIFQLIDAIRLRALPVVEPRQLTLIELADQRGWRGSQAKPWPTLTHPQWEYFRDQQQIFSGVIAWYSNGFGLGEDPRPVRGLFVSGEFFGVLGVVPHLGRVFSSASSRPGSTIHD